MKEDKNTKEDKRFEESVDIEKNPGEITKDGESKRFPSVRATTDLFGAKEGTLLRFDFESGKYVSVIESEEIGPGESYYYSGSAIALDPFLVRRYVGEDFMYINDENKEDDEGDEKEVEHVEYEEADLVSICGQCGKVTKVSRVTGGAGQQFIMALTSSALLEMRCPRCGSSMVLKYENGTPKEIEPIVETGLPEKDISEGDENRPEGEESESDIENRFRSFVKNYKENPNKDDNIDKPEDEESIADKGKPDIEDNNIPEEDDPEKLKPSDELKKED